MGSNPIWYNTFCDAKIVVLSMGVLCVRVCLLSLQRQGLNRSLHSDSLKFTHKISLYYKKLFPINLINLLFTNDAIRNIKLFFFIFLHYCYK